MKKWILALMFLLMTFQVSAMWMQSSNGGEEGWFAGIRGFFSKYDSKPQCTIQVSYINATACSGENGAVHNITAYDSNWAICCQLGGDCYRSDNNINQNYYVDEVPCGDVNMWEVALAIILIGIIFFIVYFANHITIRDDNENIVPLNAMFVLILYTSAVYMAFMTLQIGVGLALVNTTEIEILSGLKGIFRFINSIVSIVLILLIFGTMINVLWSAFQWISNRFFGR